MNLILRVSVSSMVAVVAFLLLPAMSSAADQIAYECNVDLCVVDPDAGSPTNLTNTATFAETRPVWSPDGTRLAYFGYLSGQYDLFQLTVADPTVTTNVSQTPNWGEGSAPIQWSPGGERISYTALASTNAPPDPGYDVFVSPATGTTAPLAIGSTSAGEYYGRWSPDGTKLAFTRRANGGSGAIYIGNADGSGTPTALANSGGGINPDWSRDGSKIAFVTNKIRVVNADGTGTPVEFGDTAGFTVNGPFFSPDGTRVMWQTGHDVFIRNADGTGSTTTISNPGMVGTPPSWSPDGTRIAFSAYESTFQKVQIWVANSNGTGTQRSVTPDGFNTGYPEWKPDPNAQPPVTPPVDPPVVPTRPPVTISLAQFTRPSVEGGRIPFVPIAYVSCDYPTPTALAAGCTFGADAIYKYKTSPGGRDDRVVAKKKAIKFGSGALDLAYGEDGELGLKVSKAGKKFLKPGKTLKISVTIEQRVGDDPVVKTTKTVTLKVPKKKKG